MQNLGCLPLLTGVVVGLAVFYPLTQCVLHPSSIFISAALMYYYQSVMCLTEHLHALACEHTGPGLPLTGEKACRKFRHFSGIWAPQAPFCTDIWLS